MFNFLKSNFQFEVIHSDNVQAETIDSPEALINYVIGVNNHLIKVEEDGWVYAEKFKETKKGKELLYAIKIDLPLYEDNPYFDQLLSPFYTKKKMAFEEVILPEAAKEETKEHSTPELPPELKALKKQGEEKLDLEQAIEAVEEVSDKESNEEKAEQQQVVERLMYQLELQQEEIEQLKQKNSPNVAVEDSSSTLKQSSEPLKSENNKEILPSKNYQGLSLDILEGGEQSETLSARRTVNTVSDVLETVNQKVSSCLNAYVAEEHNRINEEIVKLDTRHMIEPEVKRRIENEKKLAIEAEQIRLENERKSKIEDIERIYAEKKTNKQHELETYYSEKLAQDIATEYKVKTEQLTRILQEKEKELDLKKKEMNEGLKGKISQVLASFNDSQEKIINQLEKQRETSLTHDILGRKEADSE